MTLKNSSTPALKIGLFGIGLDTYRSLFECPEGKVMTMCRPYAVY